jgi:hypothetical protein
MKVILIILSCFLLLGCSTYKKETGDFESFLIKSLKEYGGNYKSALEKKALPNVSWKYKKDEKGFMIIVNEDIYSELKTFFIQIYGEPSIISKNRKVNPAIVYDVHTTGVAIQFYNNEEGQTIIICVSSL